VSRSVPLLTTILFIILTLSASLINLNVSLKKNRSSAIPTTQNNPNEILLQKKVFWENFLQKNPTYQDGWLQLAKINHKLGNKDKANRALKTAQTINPISQNLQLTKIEVSSL